MSDFWKSYDITAAEYGAGYECYPLFGTVHLIELALSALFLLCMVWWYRRSTPRIRRHILVGVTAALLADEESSPEMEYLRTLVWEEVEKALGELPAAQRDVFELTEMEGFTFRELAEDTGIPVATLLSRKHYAVKHLRNRLAEVYEALLYVRKAGDPSEGCRLRIGDGETSDRIRNLHGQRIDRPGVRNRFGRNVEFGGRDQVRRFRGRLDAVQQFIAPHHRLEGVAPARR